MAEDLASERAVQLTARPLAPYPQPAAERVPHSGSVGLQHRVGRTIKKTLVELLAPLVKDRRSRGRTAACRPDGTGGAPHLGFPVGGGPRPGGEQLDGSGIPANWGHDRPRPP